MCLPSEVVRNERLLRHGKVFITPHITKSHLLMEISASSHVSKKNNQKTNKHDYNFKNGSLISPPKTNTKPPFLNILCDVQYVYHTAGYLVFIFIEQNW